MSEPDRGNPIQLAVIVLIVVGGGWYFLRHYEIDGLDEVSISPKGQVEGESELVAYHDAPTLQGPGTSGISFSPAAPSEENPFTLTRKVSPPAFDTSAPVRRQTPSSLRIATWALEGFGPTKFSNAAARANIARVVRQFDIVAVQQIASVERDLIPRLVEFINHGDARYDYVLGRPTGPDDRSEHLAFIFDTTRVRVDRQQTYTIQDPGDHMTFDPLVAWFQTAQPPTQQAWTFSLVNIRIDLARAPSEVSLLPEIMSAIGQDGRGEDDVVMVGLFQADDAYLVSTLGGDKIRAAIRSRPTDIFGKYQTSNVITDTGDTGEYVGRGSVLNYPRDFGLSEAEAEMVSSQLPVYAEFDVFESHQHSH